MTIVIAQVKSVMKRIRQNTLFIGIASLVWLLLRSGARPSRLHYPCQQVSLTNTAVFLSPIIVPLACKLTRVSQKLNFRVLLLTGFVSLLTVGTLLFRIPGVSLDALHVPSVDEPILHHGALGVMALTGRTNTVDAWNDLIPYAYLRGLETG